MSSNYSRILRYAEHVTIVELKASIGILILSAIMNSDQEIQLLCLLGMEWFALVCP